MTKEKGLKIKKFMNLDLDLKKFFEKMPKTIFSKNIVLFFYSRDSIFPVKYCSKMISSERNIPLVIRDISDMDALTVIDFISGDGFFHEEKVFCLSGIDNLNKKNKDKLLVYLKKDQVNTILIHTNKWPFQKAEGKQFFNLALFDIPNWFFRKIVAERFNEFGIVENDILIEKIIEEIYAKDLDLLYLQIDKLCLFLIDKKDLSLIDSDTIKQAILGREVNSFDMLNNLLRFVLTCEINNAVSVWNLVLDYMEPIAIISYLIKNIRVFSEFFNLYGKNQFFDDFVDKYSSNTKKNFAVFNKDKTDLKKSIVEILPIVGKSFIDELKTTDIISDFSYLCSVVRKPYLEKLFGKIIQLDGEFKTGLIKTPEDIFLLLMGEMKNANT